MDANQPVSLTVLVPPPFIDRIGTYTRTVVDECDWVFQNKEAIWSVATSSSVGDPH